MRTLNRARQIPFYFLRLVFFWLIIFLIGRAVFICYNLGRFADIDTISILLSFWHALPLDISTACYVLLIPFLILALQSFVNLKFLNYTMQGYTIFALLLFSLITAAEPGIFDEWGTKLNYKALTYLNHPGEIFGSASAKLTILFFTIVIIYTALGTWLYNRFFHSRIVLEKKNYFLAVLFVLIFPGLMLLGLRGGTAQIPISQSSVYFSKHHILNTATVNSGWNLLHSVMHNYAYMDKSPYQYYDIQEAKKLVEQLYKPEKDSTINILNTDNPNVVLIILEGWTGAVIKSMGGYDSITPNFDRLVSEGLFFNNIYASGARSDQGMAAILAGFPAQPTTSIINQPNKYTKLPSINLKFQDKGYHTSYYFGGQLIYGNIRGFLYYSQFDRIIEGKDFESDIPQGKLGVHDEYLFARHIEEMNNEKQPFFSCVYTLSTHAPYDMPMNRKFFWGGKESMYINSAYYTDSCLAVYLEEAKKQPWYDNTLFVIISDHGHSSPKGYNFFSPPYRTIPLLLYGNVLKKEYRGMTIDRIGSQIDLAATLLAQFNINHSDFKWSKDLMNPYSEEFAYYGFTDGVGWLRPENHFVYEHNLDRYYEKAIKDSSSEDQIVKEGKAYLQVLFQEYLDY